MTSPLQRGIAAAKSGKTIEAMALLEGSLEEAMRARDLVAAAESLDQLAWLAWVELDGLLSKRFTQALLQLELPKTSPEAFRVFIRQATVTLQAGDPVQAAQLLDEAEKVGEMADIDSFASYLSLKGDVAGALGDWENALHHTRLALDIARKRPDRYGLWRKLAYYGYALQAAGKVRAAVEVLEEAAALADELNLTWERTLSLARAAMAAYLFGALDRAHGLILRAFEREEPHRWAYVQRSLVGVAIADALGDLDLAKRAFDERVEAIAFGGADAYSVGFVASVYHAHYRRQGRDAEADALLGAALERLNSPDCGWALLDAAARYGNAAQVEKALHLLDKFPRNHPIGTAFRLLVEARVAMREGDRSRAELRGGEAQSQFERSEWALMAARAAEAAGRISDAKVRYTAMHARGEVRRLMHQRARPGRPRSGYESQRQRGLILEMMAQGATNRMMADELGVSSRTVKYRISEIYADLGVASRAEFLMAHRASLNSV